MPNKVLSLLGMARRAGKLAWHEAANLAAIRSGNAKLLILAIDTGRSTEKRYLDKCLSFCIPLVRFTSRNNLGESLGCSPRAAVAVLDEGFAAKILTLLEKEIRPEEN